MSVLRNRGWYTYLHGEGVHIRKGDKDGRIYFDTRGYLRITSERCDNAVIYGVLPCDAAHWIEEFV